MSDGLFDVVIYEMASRKVVEFAGRALRQDNGHTNAEKRASTVSPRLNERFNVAIVPCGKYAVGDVLVDGDDLSVCLAT